MSSDTSLANNYGLGWSVYPPANSTSISIAGLGSGAVSESIYVFDNPNANAGTVGFGASGDLIDITDNTIGSTFFATYDLGSATAVYGGFADPSGALIHWNNVPTSLGAVTLTDLQNTTFQALVAPEPTSLALLALGSFALLRRRRKSA